MKIALVILHADAARGGAERYTLDLAAALVEREHTVSILASSFQKGEIAGKCVMLEAAGATRTGRYRAFLNSLDRKLDRGGYDVVHAMLPVRQCDLYHPHAGIAAEAVSRGHLNRSGKINQTIAWLANRCNTRRQQFAAVERAMLSSDRPPVVLCLSHLIQSVVSRHYPDLSGDRLVDLFNGIDLKKFDPALYPNARQEVRERYRISESATVGLMLAQDFERKGLRQAIKAMAITSDPKTFLIVGGKPNASRYQRLARELNVQERIIFAGPVQSPATYYQAADFFILPTRFDPCSLVVLEALAMGLPVISTVKNGACETMKDGIHGRVLADPDDLPALANAIQEMTATTHRAEMVNACLQLRSRLSQGLHIDHLESIYAQIIENR